MQLVSYSHMSFGQAREDEDSSNTVTILSPSSTGILNKLICKNGEHFEYIYGHITGQIIFYVLLEATTSLNFNGVLAN